LKFPLFKSVINTSVLIILFFSSIAAQPVLCGLDQISSYRQMFKNKRVGIITNHTAYSGSGKYITEIFSHLPWVQLTALFGPEHGIRGSADAGQKIASENNPLSGIPIYSLYGKTRKPTPQMLAKVDVLVFDIQDIGARFYTYIWTMALAMEACAEQGKTFVVLDRPNPIDGWQVEGNILRKPWASFVGLFPIPVRHGMTVGELARMFNDQGWLRNGIKADLKVIPMKGWKRSMWYDQTGLKFIKPSPNMPDLETATVYPGLCLLEGTNVSEGRGTYHPFLQFGAPWIDAGQLTRNLNQLPLKGLHFTETHFTPQSIPGMSTHPKFLNRSCNGCRITVTDRNIFQPYRSGIEIINTIYHLYADSFRWRPKHFDRLAGTDNLRQAIIRGDNPDEFFSAWQKPLQKFLHKRSRYLLYR